MKTKIPSVTILLMSLAFSLPASSHDDDDAEVQFVHGITLKVDGERYYFHGAADGPNGEVDAPGHSWIQDGKKLLGKHYNTGPFGAAAWWSPDMADGALLYVMEGRIDNWTEAKAAKYFANGYIHYHHIIKVSDGTPHASKVVWLKHVAVADFTISPPPHPEAAHAVEPGVDFRFGANWHMPYTGVMH